MTRIVRNELPSERGKKLNGKFALSPLIFSGSFESWLMIFVSDEKTRFKKIGIYC